MFMNIESESFFTLYYWRKCYYYPGSSDLSIITVGENHYIFHFIIYFVLFAFLFIKLYSIIFSEI